MATGPGARPGVPSERWGKGQGERDPPGPPASPPPPSPSSGLCWEAGIGFLAGTMRGPAARRRGATAGLFPRPYSLVPRRGSRRGQLGPQGSQGTARGLTGGALGLEPGAVPRACAQRGARGILSGRRGRHPAGGRRGMGAAHGSGVRAEAPSWGGKKREGDEQRSISCPQQRPGGAVSPPLGTHRPPDCHGEEDRERPAPQHVSTTS